MDAFYFNKGTNDKRGSQCKICDTIRLRQVRRRKKLDLITQFGNKCNLCGYSKNPTALEFHHLNKDKEFDFNKMNRSFSALLKEAKKCTLLCANCHRETHHPELNRE